ncbi:hypothetical protein D3C81_1269130 [compost metagenome]
MPANAGCASKATRCRRWISSSPPTTRAWKSSKKPLLPPRPSTTRTSPSGCSTTPGATGCATTAPKWACSTRGALTIPTPRRATSTTVCASRRPSATRRTSWCSTPTLHRSNRSCCEPWGCSTIPGSAWCRRRSSTTTPTRSSTISARRPAGSMNSECSSMCSSRRRMVGMRRFVSARPSWCDAI